MAGFETILSLTLAEESGDIAVNSIQKVHESIETVNNIGHADAITYFGLFLVIGAIGFMLYRSTGLGGLRRRNVSKNHRPSRSRHNELGSGDLASKAAIKRWLQRKDKYDTILPVGSLKGGDGFACKDGYLHIPREERNRHILIIAKTGSGKTTKAILPVLFNDCLCPDRSTIVIDSKPEMWDKLVGMTRKYNPKKNIMLFNPLDIARSMSWNILAKVENDTDAKLIANTIIMATEQPGAKADSPFFKNNALALLNAMMVGLLNDPTETLSMPRIHELVHGGMSSLCDWLEAHPHALRSSKTFVDLARSGSQNADTIMSELGMRLSAWDLSAIRATTGINELDLEKLISEPTLFIVELRESELEMLRPMANVIVVEILRFLTKRAENCPGHTLPRPVGFVIDEFASALGRLPDIHVKLNTLRSRNVSIVAAIQSIGQIKANYDKDADSVLTGFSTKILMPELDFQDAEWGSKETGTMTVRFNVASQGKNKRMIDVFASVNDNLQEQVQQRAVLTPDEIGKPADNAATFFMPNTPVFQGHLIPYYEVPDMIEKFKAGKDVQFSLRDKPIDLHEDFQAFAAKANAGAGGGGGKLAGEQAKKQLEETRTGIGWETSDQTSKDWWVSFEQANQHNLQVVVDLGNDLIKRGIDLSKFYAIYASSGASDLPGVIAAVDRFLLEEYKARIGWQTISPHARDWWVAFEQANSGNFPVVLELSKELLRREATIDDFFAAYVHTDFETVPEILNVLDQILGERKRSGLSPAPGTVSTTVQAQVAAPVQAQPQVAYQQPQYQQPPQQQPPQQQVQYQQPAYSQPAPVQQAPQYQPPVYQQSAYQPAYAESPYDGIDLFGEKPAPAETAPPAEETVSRKTSNQAAARGVHVESYYSMAEDLLRQGNFKDFDMLVQLAREDARFSPDDIEGLNTMRNRFSNAA